METTIPRRVSLKERKRSTYSKDDDVFHPLPGLLLPYASGGSVKVHAKGKVSDEQSMIFATQPKHVSICA